MAQVYALIRDDLVENIIWLAPENAHEFPTAVPCGDFPAQIGDLLRDGVFYREGVAVTATPVEKATLVEQLAEAEAALAIIQEATNG